MVQATEKLSKDVKGGESVNRVVNNYTSSRGQKLTGRRTGVDTRGGVGRMSSKGFLSSAATLDF